jgi:hypothetical protein
MTPRVTRDRFSEAVFTQYTPPERGDLWHFYWEIRERKCIGLIQRG